MQHRQPLQGNGPPAAVPPVPTIILQLSPNGELQVGGNVANKFVAIGMLETAKVALLSKKEEPAPLVVSPPAGMPDLRGG